MKSDSNVDVVIPTKYQNDLTNLNLYPRASSFLKNQWKYFLLLGKWRIDTVIPLHVKSIRNYNHIAELDT